MPLIKSIGSFMHIQASWLLPYLYTFGLMAAGLVYLATQPSIFNKASRLEASRGSWLDFLIFVWGITMAFCLSVYLTKVLPLGLVRIGLTPEKESNPLLSTSLLELSVGLGLILSFRYQKAFWSPALGFFPRAWLPLIKTAAIWLLVLFPFLCVGNFLWQLLLSTLVQLQWIQPLKQQSIISAFLESPNGLYTLILSCNALLLAPFLEELVFRGGIYRFFKGQLRGSYASVLSAFLFAILHGNTLSFLPLWILGWWLNTLYEKTGSIWSPIVLHSLFNANSLLLLYLSKGMTFF